MSQNPFGDEKLEFPLDCHFKVIVSTEALDIRARLEIALAELGINAPLEPGTHSSGGKYQTFNLTVNVQSEIEMRKIDNTLRGIDGVKMVL